MSFEHLDPSDFLKSLPGFTKNSRSPFSGEPLVPPDSKTVIDGYRLSAWQAEQVRNRDATVLARNGTDGTIICRSATGRRYVLGLGPDEE